MLAHLLDHFIFTAKRLTERTKWIVFGVTAFTIFATFWWFRGLAFGIDGPINEHWGLHWRKVRKMSPLLARSVTDWTTFSIAELEHI